MTYSLQQEAGEGGRYRVAVLGCQHQGGLSSIVDCEAGGPNLIVEPVEIKLQSDIKVQNVLGPI